MALTNAYATLEEVKNDLGNIGDTDSDVALDRAINAASRQIDRFCGQRFWQDGSTVAREFSPLDLYDLEVDGEFGGISTTTGLVVKVDQDGDGVYETTLTSGTDYLLRPSNAADLSPAEPWSSLRFGLAQSVVVPPRAWYGRPTVEITAKWGWPAVPAEVVEACVLQAMQLWKAKDAVFGVAAFGEFGPLRVGSSLNPIAAGLLAPFQRPGVA